MRRIIKQPVFDEKAAREQEYRIREAEREKRKTERTEVKGDKTKKLKSDKQNFEVRIKNMDR